MHRGRAGMGILAGDRDLVPAHALHAGDDADHLALVLEDRSLLDVKLEHGAEPVAARFLGAAIADAVELVAEASAVAVFARHKRSPRVNTPANTPDASMAGAKREPSSLVQLTISIGALVS